MKLKPIFFLDVRGDVVEIAGYGSNQVDNENKKSLMILFLLTTHMSTILRMIIDLCTMHIYQ